MTKIRCYYLDCLFLDERHCTAAAVDINPDSGCLTYRPIDDEAESLWEVEEEEDELDDADY